MGVGSQITFSCCLTPIILYSIETHYMGWWSLNLSFFMLPEGAAQASQELRELPSGRCQGESCPVIAECVCQHLTHHSVNTSDYCNSTHLVSVLLSSRTLASFTLHSFDLFT